MVEPSCVEDCSTSRPQFGSRYLVNEEDVFQHNAWYGFFEKVFRLFPKSVSHEAQEKAPAWVQVFAG